MNYAAQMKALAAALAPTKRRAAVIVMGEDELGDMSRLVRTALIAASSLPEAKLGRIDATLKD